MIIITHLERKKMNQAYEQRIINLFIKIFLQKQTFVEYLEFACMSESLK